MTTTIGERRYQTEQPSEALGTRFQLARQVGRQQGRHEGEALGLLRLKLGEIPGRIRARIAQADADTLLTWSERILTAEHIEDVIA